MIKSLSVNDAHNSNLFQGQTQPYFKTAIQNDDDLILENIKQASQFLTTESSASLSPVPGDRFKKRIKLRINQKFPTDFFDNHREEGQENTKNYQIKNIPVKVIRAPELLQPKNSAQGEPRHSNNTPSFGSQLYMSTEPAEEKAVPFQNKQQFEGLSSREMVDMRSIGQMRSRSHERGSVTGVGMYSFKMRPQPLNTRIKLEEIHHNYSSVGPSPLQPIENDQRSASRLKRGGLQTPRKDGLSSFRKARHVTFNLNSEEKSYENTSIPIAEASHVVISNSYYYSSRGITYQPEQAIVKQMEDDFQAIQMLKKEPVKLGKSASRDSFTRENEFLRVSRTNRLYLKSINKEQSSLPLTSSRKTLRVFRADESENSRMTSEREIESHYMTEPMQGTERSARQKIVPHKSIANFHKTIIKSIGLSSQENLLMTKNGSLVAKTIAMMEQEPKKDSSLDLIAKIGRKVAEQKNHREIVNSYMLKEGHDFSFSKEYSKEESIAVIKTQTKEPREKTPSPERQEGLGIRYVESRAQPRIRKKFVLIKRDESGEKTK